MDRIDMGALPGGDLVAAGLSDLERHQRTVAALLVSIGAPKLRALGLSVPEAFPHAEHALYALLSEDAERGGADSAHGRYNALVRRLVSFERAVACAR
jgi:hypothetical protein